MGRRQGRTYKRNGVERLSITNVYAVRELTYLRPKICVQVKMEYTVIRRVEIKETNI